MNTHNNRFAFLLTSLLLSAAACFCQIIPKPIIGAINWDAWNGGYSYYAERQTVTPPYWAHLRPFFTDVYNDTNRLTRLTLDTAECIYQLPGDIVGYCLQTAFDRSDAGKNINRDVWILFSTDGNNFVQASGSDYASNAYADDVYERNYPISDQSWLKVNYNFENTAMASQHYRYIKILLTRTTGSPGALQIMRLEINTGNGWTVFADELNDFSKMFSHSPNLTIAHDNAVRFECIQGNNHRQSIRDQEILYAEKAGIDFWAFTDYEDADFCVNGYHETMVNSIYKDRIKYCIIFTTGTSSGSAWTKRVTRCAGYMKEFNYQTVMEGRPLVFLFSGNGQSAAQITEFRDSVKSAGLPNPYIVVMGGTPSYPVDAYGSYAGGNGWESWGSKVVPCANFGWNDGPRTDNPPPWGGGGGAESPALTPNQIIDRLKRLVQWTQNNRSIAETNVAMFYAWNEVNEGGFVIPTRNADGSPNTARIDAMHDYLILDSMRLPQLIKNPCFNDSAYWRFNTETGATAAFAVKDGIGQVTISNGNVNYWDIELYQTGFYLNPGRTYHVIFEAKASAARMLQVSISPEGSPRTSVWSQFISLTTSLQSFGEYTFVFNGDSALACRLNFLAGADDNSVFIDNVEFHAENLALPAVVTASSTQGSGGQYDVHNVNDGIATTDFYSWASTSTPAWLQLDFPATVTFNRVELYTTTDYELKDYSIQYWDGTSWVDAAVVTGNTLAHRSTSFSFVTCSRIRVYAVTGSAAQPNYARICELEIYNEIGSTGLEEDGVQNEPISLSVYPSPFNPTTQIRYEIPKTSARIELAIFDAAGRFVRSLPAASGSGSIMWNGEDNSGRKVSSGVYIVRLKAGNQVIERRGLFVK